MDSAREASFCMAKTPERDKTTPANNQRRTKGNEMEHFREENDDAEKSEEYPPTPHVETEAEPNSQNDFQGKEDDKDSLPIDVETPAIDENNHDNPWKPKARRKNPIGKKR